MRRSDPVSTAPALEYADAGPRDPRLEHLWYSGFLGRIAERMRQLDQSQPYALDTLLAVFVAALGAFDLLVVDRQQFFPAPVTAPAGWVALSMAGQAAPLVWRRRRPTTVFALVLGFSVLQWSLGVAPRSAAGLLIALYAVGRYGRNLPLYWAFLASIGALSIAAFFDLPFRKTPWTSEFLLGCTAVASATLAMVARYRRAKVAELADRAARLEIEREQLATVAERERVAREMHDIVGHNLAVIIGLADGAAFAADTADTSRSSEALHLIADTGRQALSELRRTLEVVHAVPAGSARVLAETDVQGALSPQPGIAQLPTLFDRVREAGLRVTYRSAGDCAAVSAGVQLATYRIIQEALTNTLRHGAPGTVAQVDVLIAEEEITIRVCDGTGTPDTRRAESRGRAARPGRDGTGLGAAEGGGRGLRGIVERATLMGGSADAGASDGGWVVRASIPLRAGPTRRIGAGANSKPGPNSNSTMNETDQS